MWYFIITLLLFSSMEVVTKPFMSTTDPFTLTWYRFVLGWGVLTGWAVFTGKFRSIFSLPKRKILLLAFLGFLNTFFSMSMLQLAVKHGSPATAALIFCSNPVFVYLLTVITGGVGLSGEKIIGFFVSIIGLAIVTGFGDISFETGAVYALAGSFSFALYTILNKRAVFGSTPLTVNIVSFFFGIVISFVYIVATGRHLIPHDSLYSDIGNISAMLYLGFGVSGIGYITFISAIRKLSAVSASLLFMLKPVFAALFSVFLLGKLPSTIFYIGSILILSGIVLIKKDVLKKIR